MCTRVKIPGVCCPGACREEQAVHLHQDPGGARPRVVQGQQGEEPGGRARPAAGAAHARVPQRYLDLARPAARHQERHQEVTLLLSVAIRVMMMLECVVNVAPISQGDPVAGHPAEAAAAPARGRRARAAGGGQGAPAAGRAHGATLYPTPGLSPTQTDL